MYTLPWLRPQWAWLTPFIITLSRISGCLALAAALALPGCRTADAVKNDPLMWSRAFNEAGAETVVVTVMFGDGHILGQAYNIFGTHAAVQATFKPSAVPVERIVAFMPPDIQAAFWQAKRAADAAVLEAQAAELKAATQPAGP